MELTPLGKQFRQEFRGIYYCRRARNLSLFKDFEAKVDCHSSWLGYIMGAGKTMVILIRVSQVRVQCVIFPPVATLYPLSQYYGLGQLILLYNSKKNCKSVLYNLFFTTRLPAPATLPNLSFKVSPGVI